MSWLVYVLLSVALFTALNLLQRKLAIDSENPQAMSSAFNLNGGSLALLFFVLSSNLSQLSVPHTVLPWVLILAAITCYGLFERGRFLVAQLLTASVFAMIANITLIMVVILSVLFLGESLTVVKLFGIVCILGSLLLVTYKKEQKAVSPKGIFLGVVITMLLGSAD